MCFSRGISSFNVHRILVVAPCAENEWAPTDRTETPGGHDISCRHRVPSVLPFYAATASPKFDQYTRPGRLLRGCSGSGSQLLSVSICKRFVPRRNGGWGASREFFRDVSLFFDRDIRLARLRHYRLPNRRLGLPPRSQWTKLMMNADQYRHGSSRVLTTANEMERIGPHSQSVVVTSRRNGIHCCLSVTGNLLFPRVGNHAGVSFYFSNPPAIRRGGLSRRRQEIDVIPNRCRRRLRSSLARQPNPDAVAKAHQRNV